MFRKIGFSLNKMILILGIIGVSKWTLFWIPNDGWVLFVAFILSWKISPWYTQINSHIDPLRRRILCNFTELSKQKPDPDSNIFLVVDCALFIAECDRFGVITTEGYEPSDRVLWSEEELSEALWSYLPIVNGTRVSVN